MRCLLPVAVLCGIVSCTCPPDESLAGELPSVELRWAADGPGGVPGFTRHVQPLLGKAGCSNRACHGSFQGQGGFRLSLFGSDPALDHTNLKDSGRVDPAAPDDSLALQKPTQVVDHEGGERFPQGSWQHRLLRSWIAAGARYTPQEEATVERLEVTPPRLTLAARGETAALRVTAHFADGTAEDVTGLTQFSSNDDRIAAIDAAGEVVAGEPGDTALIAVFGGEVRSVSVVVPFAGTSPDLEGEASDHPIDTLVAARLKELRIPASGLSGDEEFLRRVSLDITGTLPTPAEIQAFVGDPSADKRRRKIDELLERPAYVLLWSTRFCDVTGLNAPLFLGNTDFGPLMGDMWHRWVERRFRDNTPYDRIVEGMVVGTSRHPGESYEAYSERMSSYVKNEGAADFTAEPQLPHFWFRENLKTPDEKALGIAYAFLGVRLECAQCHKHPFDRWTQHDFRQFASLFSRVQKGVASSSRSAYDQIKGRFDAETLRTAATRRQTYWKLARQGERVPWPEVFVTPLDEPLPKDAEDLPPIARMLGGPTVDVRTEPDPRQPLMAWMRSPENPYFAPAFVNRVWSYYFGQGLVNPADDFNLANPPSHPELLASLARRFIDSGFDMKWLHREITTSRSYQRTWRPLPANRTDERSYSHTRIRRLPAEVAVDAIQQATAGAKELADVAVRTKDRRIGIQPTADLRRTEYGLAVFGKPLRKVNCDCEREMDPSLLQSVYLRNDPDLAKMLDRPGGWLSELAENGAAAADADQLIVEAYLRSVSRFPTESERRRCRQYLDESPALVEGLRDVLWSLLNTQEFITNH